MADDNSERKRISIPKADESVLTWWDAQKDPAQSVRLLIRAEIERNGYTDTAFRPVVQQPRRGRPPGSVDTGEDLDINGSESVSPVVVSAPVPVVAPAPVSAPAVVPAPVLVPAPAVVVEPEAAPPVPVQPPAPTPVSPTPAPAPVVVAAAVTGPDALDALMNGG